MRQNFMEWIKRFGQEIWVKIEDRLAWCLAVFVVAIFTMACLALKEQAFDKHAVEMYGWVWLLILSCIIFLAGYFLRDVFGAGLAFGATSEIGIGGVTVFSGL